MIEPNILTLIALSNEFCESCENARNAQRDDFIATMTRLLPRLYITAQGINPDFLEVDYDDVYLQQALDEEQYNQIRGDISALLGEEDTYLEAFEQDMKYSETPIAVTISENLADIFQVCYNFVETVKDATDETTVEAANGVAYDFRNYWSQSVVNVMRPLNQLRYDNPHT